MNQDEAKALIARLYRRIAPDVDFNDIDPDADFREEAEVDSMDFFNFLVALKQETGFDVPESDYGQLDTLNHAAAYVAEALSKNASE
jgi:acyl carrier protein